MRRAFPVLIGLMLLVAACGSDELEPFAVVASTNGSIGVGQQRILFSLIDPVTDEFLASPDRTATVTIRDENGSPLDTYPMEFVWSVPDVRGLYVAQVEIPEAATYQATIDADGLATAGPVGFVAFEDPPLIQPGEAAPPSETKTSADFPDLSVISSDPDPDPAMYEMSVADAVSSGAPSVVVFATPAFCVSQTCGPLLDQVKALRPDHPGVGFVHVEIYEDLQAEPEELTVVPAVTEWGLPSEPWVFVVDDTGVVTAIFEGAASDAELAAAIDAVGG
jgi:hypothetical protein